MTCLATNSLAFLPSPLLSITTIRRASSSVDDLEVFDADREDAIQAKKQLMAKT
jgi:hypothetical protein